VTLLDELEAAGLNVQPYGDWVGRGGNWAGGQPSGIMHHHTAAPVPFPTHRLIGDRLKANIQTQPDGKVWLLAGGACNYSSGPGNYGVLRDVRLGITPTANARERGLVDTTNGNPHFFNFENDHLGQGQPLPDVQFEAIVTATQVVADHYGLDAANQTISHAEWTKRKTDPFWNGDRRAIEKIRTALQEDPMTLSPQAQAFLQAMYDDLQANLNPPTVPSWARYVIQHVRDHPTSDGGLTEQQVKDLINDGEVVWSE